MRLTSLHSLALGSALALGCSSAPDPRPEAVGAGSDVEALTDLPSAVDESALDRTANPCDDFYQFSCGGYLNSVTLSSDYDIQSRTFGGENAANREALTELLAAAAANRSNPEDRKVADYYAACVAFNTDRAPGKLAEGMAGELRTVHDARKRGGFSALLGRGLRSALGVGAEYHDLGSSQPLFRAYPAPDRDRNAGVIALNVAPTYSIETDHDTVAYQVADNFPSLSAADQEALTQLVVRVDIALDGAIAGDFQSGYQPIGRAGLARAMPHVDWDTFFTQLGVPDAKRVVLWSVPALTAIDGILATLHTDELVRYMDYKLVTSWLYPDGYSGTPAAAAETACARETANALAGIVEHRFTNTVMGKKNVKLAMAMAQAELATFEKQLTTTAFLDDATRAEAIAKAKAMKMTPLLEPRDRYRDVTISRTAFMEDQLALWNRASLNELARVDRKPGKDWTLSSVYFTAEAFYDPEKNQFTIFPGIAHGGFFGGSSATPAFNFGALGSVIGHEITHGFDSTGRHYDGQGADRDWWSASSAAAFEERAACFVDQYSAIPIDGVIDPDTGLTVHIDGEYSLGENIADNGGIRTAWLTAQPYFAGGKMDAGFTPEQQFFISAGQVDCDKRGPGAVLSMLHYDPHATHKARVNVTLSNFEKFAEVFQCKATDRMVAQPACRIW